MRRYLLPGLLAAVIGGCGRTPAAAPETAASPETPAAAVAAPDQFADVKAARVNYEKAVAANPGSLAGLRRLADQNRAFAQNRGDHESVKFFDGEIERLAAAYREFCEGIYAKAKRDADLCLEWQDRYGRWEKCAVELMRACPENTALIAMAKERQDRATLMEKATTMFDMEARAAKDAIEQNEDPETAVAKLVIFRAWMRGSGLIKPVEEGEAAPVDDDGAGEILKKTDALIAEYETKCVAEAPAADGDAMYRDLEFLADFQWAGEGGECTSEGNGVKVEAGENGGSIECLHNEWLEFELLLEVRLAETGRLWFGARPQVAGDRKEYKKKCKVELDGEEWHRLRVHVTAGELRIAQIKGEKGEDISVVGGPIELPPVGAVVKPGFMIGLEGGVTVEIRNLKARVTKGGEGFVKEDESSRKQDAPEETESPEEEEADPGMEPGGVDPGGEEAKPEGGEEAKPEGGEEAKPEGGEEAKPEGGEEAKPEGGGDAGGEGEGSAWAPCRRGAGIVPDV